MSSVQPEKLRERADHSTDLNGYPNIEGIEIDGIIIIQIWIKTHIYMKETIIYRIMMMNWREICMNMIMMGN